MSRTEEYVVSSAIAVWRGLFWIKAAAHLIMSNVFNFSVLFFIFQEVYYTLPLSISLSPSLSLSLYLYLSLPISLSHTHTHKHTNAHTLTRTHIHTHTHTHTHTRTHTILAECYDPALPLLPKISGHSKLRCSKERYHLQRCSCLNVSVSHADKRLSITHFRE